jgi:hypothetical protein
MMNIRREGSFPLVHFLVCFAILASPRNLHAQAFANLDFEGAFPGGKPAGNPFTFGAADALPHWQVRLAGVPQTTVDNGLILLLTGSIISIAQVEYHPGIGPTFEPDDPYAVLLQTYIPPIPPTPPDLFPYGEAVIAQTGLVPPDAQSLRVFILPVLSTPPVARLGGQSLDLFPSGNLGEWVADVTPWAGQIRELELTGARTIFEGVAFSPSPAPEPTTTLPILAFGASATLMNHRRRRRATI